VQHARLHPRNPVWARGRRLPRNDTVLDGFAPQTNMLPGELCPRRVRRSHGDSLYGLLERQADAEPGSEPNLCTTAGNCPLTDRPKSLVALRPLVLAQAGVVGTRAMDPLFNLS
jgi:hypothetical protein